MKPTELKIPQRARNQRKYHIITYGCQMNVNDSERIASLLEGVGMHAALKPDHADLIVINTCSVRQSAEDRVFGQVHNFKSLKARNPALRVAVTGCMPGRDLDGVLRAKMPSVDFFFPIQDVPHLPYWVMESWAEHTPRMQVLDNYLAITPNYRSSFQAFVTIQAGCNNFCTFCVVPYSRGRERSRPVKDILTEVRALAEKGVKEVTLLGQNVNTFRPPDKEYFSPHNPFHDPFAALLWEINQVSGITRIHFTAPNPQDMTDEVIEALGLAHHVNYLHLPVQSGNNEVLKRMNRRHSREAYLAIIEKVRRVRPSIAIGTDIIVGFCGETRAQFEDTLALYREVQFDIAYIARYSPRSHTLAAKLWEDDVPQEEKKSRWLMLQHLMEDVVRRKNGAYRGKTVSVLVDASERTSRVPRLPMPKKDEVLLAGNSREMKRVKLFGPKRLIGSVVPVRIVDTQEWVLWGKKA